MFKAKLSLLKFHVGKEEGSVPLVVAKYLSTDRRKQCQEVGVCFLDLSGNIFLKKLNLREAREGANLIFLLPYYKYSIFYGKQRIRNLWVVSDLQLYLDLHNYPVRGLEQAEHLYEKRLKQIIEGTYLL